MIRALPIAFLLAVGAMSTWADDSARLTSGVAELPYLAAVRGRDPHLLLDDDRVAPLLAKTFSPAKIDRLRATHLTKIERSDGHLVFSGYLPGSGFDNGAVVFIDLGTGLVRACWSEDGIDTWLAPERAPRPLGRDTCINDAESLLTKFEP